MGWVGDAQVFSRTASYNYNVERFFDKWLEDMRLDQYPNGSVPYIIPLYWGDCGSTAVWSDAITICPWQMYLTYGNKKILAKMFPAMKKYVDYIINK